MYVIMFDTRSYNLLEPYLEYTLIRMQNIGVLQRVSFEGGLHQVCKPKKLWIENMILLRYLKIDSVVKLTQIIKTSRIKILGIVTSETHIYYNDNDFYPKRMTCSSFFCYSLILKYVQMWH